jgi:hypothetical protein
MPSSIEFLRIIRATDPSDTRTAAEIAEANEYDMTDRDIRHGDQDLALHRRRATA